ncbi:MAG: phosphoribosylamine---glycine ligase [Chloroflexota bacterium]|nr:phosphoribosylamine---glycine ligase [Chloroflexota bacterium]
MTDLPRILVVGSGAREHALSWSLSARTDREPVAVAPGNPGMGGFASTHPLDPMDAGAIASIARERGVDVVVIGPEAPLVAGVADDLRAAGIAVFGPGRDGARLEGSKSYCREVAEAAGVPIADGRSFARDEHAAIAFARALGGPVVIKADGLAAGKGVTVCATLDEAEAAVLECRPRFGAAGERIVVERALIGREVSVIAITDGQTTLALPAARDHKRVGDDDRGPNTGGMGAYSPVEDVPDELAASWARTFHQPLLAELARRGIAYSGALYAGLMVTDDGPQLLECNVRFGDPESQALLPRLAVDTAALLLGAATGRLAEAAAAEPIVDGRIPGGLAAVGVVLAVAGYPDAPRFGDPIASTLPRHDPALVFWSGVATAADGMLVTAGGRVVTVVGRGPSLAAAADEAYRAAAAITFPGVQFRRDIGRVAVTARAGAGFAA